ncbi:MAG TPA: hypothetical protein VMU87_18990 [Stellaceae bacterium]|nr:hypothetical protein [Stellaceae bacterium]
MTDEAERERGFALVLVIWVLALLSILAAALAVDSRNAVEIARNRLELAHARAAADAGATLAIYGLLDPNLSGRWRADGTTRTVRYNGSTVAIRVGDEGGKIDLNVAAADFIGDLLAELGIDGRQAIVADILSRRQSFAAELPSFTTGRRLPGTDPGGVNRSVLPFATASELRLFTAISRADYERIRPYVTVYSQAPTVNPLTAPRAVLLAVPGVSAQQVDFLIAARAAASVGQPADIPRLSGVDRYVAPRDIPAATITATATTKAGASFAREAIVSLSLATPLQPFRIEQWGQAITPSVPLQARKE